MAGATTVTVALALLVGSAALVAVTETIPGRAGAVKTPPEVMAPALTLQVTPVLLVPVTRAVRVRLRPAVRIGVAGFTVMRTGDAVTVTKDFAQSVGSARLCALTR